MGIFHYPRINFKGLLRINVATANNDDYSGNQFAQGSPNAGKPVRLADSVNVQPVTYGMTDAEWNEWAITPLSVYKPPRQAAPINKSEGGEANMQILPGEWNFFGDMGLTMMNTIVTGITDPLNKIPAPLKASLSQGLLSFNNRPGNTGRSTGMIIDVNPEDVNSSQVFSDFLSLESAGTFLLSGKPTKAVTRWINFQRNCNLTGSNGAAGTFQMVVPLSQLQGQPILDAMPANSPDGAKLAGIVFRYVMFRGMQEINVFKYAGEEWIKAMTNLYATRGMNPDYTQLQGTIAPWFEGEPVSCPIGRFLVPASNVIPVPVDCRGNGPAFRLCPALLNIDWEGNNVIVDFSSTFPEWYHGQFDPFDINSNPKWDFGPLTLNIHYEGSNEVFAPVDYTNTQANDALGWIFEFPFDPATPGLKEKLINGDFSLVSERYQVLLSETPYLIVSDESGLYAEQLPDGTTTTQFRNDGAGLTPASFTVFKRGIALTDAAAERLTLWYYDTTPNEQPGNRNLLFSGYKSGTPIALPTVSPGNRFITATLSTGQMPPASYSDIDPMMVPTINIRILPYVNYDRYYIDPSAPQPVGNDLLTFDVIYQEIFRNYYLLYPAMSMRIPLNDPQQWSDAEMAGRLMQRASLDFWGTSEAMPRTRDLSQSRRTLLNAWCLKFFNA